MSSKVSLNKIIKTHKLQKKADLIFGNEPYLEVVALNLIEFITPHFVVNNMPLIDQCIISAFSEVDEEKPFAHNVKSYLQNIVSHAHFLIDKRIAVENKVGMSAWVPMQESVQTFLSRHADQKPIMVNDDDVLSSVVSKKEASLMLAVHIMPAYAVSMALECVCEGVNT